jgi:hypothetical protein
MYESKDYLLEKEEELEISFLYRESRCLRLKRVLSIFMIILTVSSTIMAFTPKVAADTSVIFQDDFESYAVSTFPSAGGWQIVWNGAGNQYQVITNSYYASPTKSLQLVGSYGWSVVVKKDFSTSSNLIGYEAKMMSTNAGGGGSIGFFNGPIAQWGRYYATVGFGSDGYIGSGSSKLQPFTPFTWYKVRVVLDKVSRIYNVWIDDVLKGQNLVEPNNPAEILSLHFGVGWTSVAHYFDDIKVFAVTGGVIASIAPSNITTTIGSTALYNVGIRNYANTSDTYTLTVNGILSSWYSLSEDQLHLNPWEIASVQLNVTVPENPSNVGTLSFNVAVTGLLTQKVVSANLTVILNPQISNLNPQNGTTIGSRDALISWKTSSNGTSEVYIKRVGNSTFDHVVGEYGSEHLVQVYNLTRNVDYIWYVCTRTLYGSATSETRILHVGNGISFVRDVYDLNVQRDYAQQTSVSVINTDSQPHDLLLQAINPYADLIVGFVGAGSIDQNVTVAPNEARSIEFDIYAQDTMQENYTLTVKLTNLGAEQIVDTAIVNVHVKQPNINLQVVATSIQNVTLTKTYTVTNNGDTVTDLRIAPDDSLKDQILIQPVINHAMLQNGESLTFNAVPVLTTNFSGLQGNLVVEAAGITKNIPINDTLPPSKNVYTVLRNDVTWRVDFSDWYCTNRPTINEVFMLPSAIKQTFNNQPNVDSAEVIAYFSLPWSIEDYRPHNVHFFMNNVEIGALMNTIPSGVYQFPFSGTLLNYASEGLAQNTLTLHMDNLNGGHYVVSAKLVIVLHVRQIELNIVASSQAEAETIADQLLGTISNYVDLCTTPEAITFSNPQPKEDEKITISAEIDNLGTLGAQNVPVTLYVDSTKIDTQVISSTPSFSTQEISFDWTAIKGSHEITITVNENKVIAERDYTNNQASKAITVLSIPPSIQKYIVEPISEINDFNGGNNPSVEKGAAITAYFKVESWDGANYAYANNIDVSILTSVDSSYRVITSRQFDGLDGVIIAGSYDTTSYSGTDFYINIKDTVFYGVPVVGSSPNFLIHVKPRTSTAGAGFDLSASAALVGVEGIGNLQDAFLILNDGTNALDVITQRNIKMGLGLSFPYVPDFAITVPGFSAEAGASLDIKAGLMGGGNCHYSNPSDSTQASLIRYLVTLNMLDYVRANAPALDPAIDALRSAIAGKISELGVSSYYSPLHAGGWFGGSISGGDGKLKCTIPFLMIGGKPVSFTMDANSLISGFTPPSQGSVSVEISQELKKYPDMIGICFHADFEGFASFDLNFASLSGTGINAEVGLEFKFDSSTYNLKTVSLELSLEGTKETLEACGLGGLLKTDEMSFIALAPSRTYKVTLTLEVPVTNAGTLYDYLKTEGLLILNGALAVPNVLELLTKIYDSIKDGAYADYNVTVEQKDIVTIPFKISLPSIDDLPSFEFSFDFKYLQTQSYLAGNGYVTYLNGQIGIWPALSYPQPPQDFSVPQFILNNLLDLKSLSASLGTVVHLQETQSKLYLHVYDINGNHVGFNIQQNITEVNIPGAGYYDYQNGMIDVVLPANLDNFTIDVDGSQAHYAHENFTLQIYRFGRVNSTLAALSNQIIQQGATRRYLTKILSDDTIINTELLSVFINPNAVFVQVGQSTTFISTVYGGASPYSYQWYLNDSQVSGATSDTWTFTPTTSATFFIHLRVTDASGNTTLSETAKVTVTKPYVVGGYSLAPNRNVIAIALSSILAMIGIMATGVGLMKRKLRKRE